jgi:hypothetical protein
MPSRSQILASVQRADFNPLACRVARAVADYELAFDAEARRCGSFEYIRLAPPTDEIEAVALDLFLGSGGTDPERYGGSSRPLRTDRGIEA